MVGVKYTPRRPLPRNLFVLIMLKCLCLGIGSVVLCISIALGDVQAEHRHNPSKTISMARATWDTGWFQTEIIKKLLEDLGYTVERPKTMDNRDFYLAAARGEMDLWANGWFPIHTPFIEDERVRGKVEAVGFEVVAGALQGYMVDKKTAEALNIRNLEDFKNPRIAKVFDRDGDGRADLIGCNAGWGCERVIEHHLDALQLHATVEHIQGDYSPLMDETVARYKKGQPIFFYTWTPNWTVGTLVPGKDVVWIEVPSAGPPTAQEQRRNRAAVMDVPGCSHNPCAMGFQPNDIRIVVNSRFLETHPDIRLLLSKVEIPLEDITRQNAKMLQGEDSYADIQHHAKAWISRNRYETDRWLSEAKALQSAGKTAGPPKKPPSTAAGKKILRVVTQRSEPFVIYRNRQYTGFSIELWEKIARDLGLDYRIYGVNTIAKVLDDVQRGAADLAISSIGITSKRERTLDFSHPYFESGLQIMVPKGSQSLIGSIILKAVAVIFSRELLGGLAVFIIVLLIAAHIMWLLERNHNPQFATTYPRGLWHAIWWAVVTVTTVGYGDKTPIRNLGRLFGLLWILAGYFVFAYLTASVTSTVTVQQLHGTINGPEDLFGKRVATVEKSTAAEYLATQGLTAVKVDNIEKAYQRLEAGKVAAIVYDSPVLQHFASKKGKGKVRIVGLVFNEKSYGIVLPEKSDLRDRINITLLKLKETGEFEQLNKKWFGS
jgi:ABC-type proline/glycine betaine transport system substrate-binding protein/ABC-type amino acid transport substrate-binding protein